MSHGKLILASIMAAGAVLAAVPGAGFTWAQGSAAEAASTELTADILAAAFQDAVDALPEDANQEDIEVALQAVIEEYEPDPLILAAALAILATNNADDEPLIAAITAVANDQGVQPPVAGGGGNGALGGASAPGGGSGGNSDY